MVYFHIYRSPEIINNPHNTRQNLFAARVVRGRILDRNGNVLAETRVAEDGSETRHYPHGDLFAHVVGYNTRGMAGLELTENFNLLTSNAFFLERMANEFRDEKNIGDNVVTTLDLNLQRAAYDALGNNRGAVIVMEASTGRILAMVSKPAFDANTVNANWDSLIAREDSVLLNRATQGLYAPGSTFKMVTSLEYMRQNSGYEAFTYRCHGEIVHGDTRIRCLHGTAHGDVNLRTSFALSCNTAYSYIGLGLNRTSYARTARELLFDSSLPGILPYSRGRFNINQDSTDAEMMMTAMGQGETIVSPYHMALITAAIANGGMLMRPYLVEEITNHTGSRVRQNMPRSYGTLMTSSEAARLREDMRAVVTEGTGTMLNNSSYTVAGKTGTAEYGAAVTNYHSWFVGFTNVDNPELVISVVIEGAGTTGARAVPVVRQVLDAYYLR